MYVIDAAACSLPNSQTPMSAARIAAQDARMAAAARHFNMGNLTLQQLVTALGGNYVPAGAGDAGIPTTGGGAGFANPGWLPSLNLSPRGRTAGGGGSVVCVNPEPLPLQTVFPIPLPVPAVVPTAPAPVAVPVAAAPVATCPTPTPDNICELIRDGCVLSSQVTPEQLYACSWAGWAGNRIMYPATAAAGGWGGGQWVGALNLNPKNPRGEQPPPRPGAGVSGVPLTGAGSSAVWASLGLLAFSLWAARELDRGRGRR